MIGTESSTPPLASDDAHTTQSTSSVVLMIDEHRNHLAVQEAYNFLRDHWSSPNLNPDTYQVLRRVLLRLSFFLVHSKCPTLTESDRLALIRFQQHELARQLDQAPIQRRGLLPIL